MSGTIFTIKPVAPDWMENCPCVASLGKCRLNVWIPTLILEVDVEPLAQLKY